MPSSSAQASAVPEQDVAIQRDTMKHLLVPRQPLRANCGDGAPLARGGMFVPAASLISRVCPGLVARGAHSARLVLHESA